MLYWFCIRFLQYVFQVVVHILQHIVQSTRPYLVQPLLLHGKIPTGFRSVSAYFPMQLQCGQHTFLHHLKIIAIFWNKPFKKSHQFAQWFCKSCEATYANPPALVRAVQLLWSYYSPAIAQVFLQPGYIAVMPYTFAAFHPSFHNSKICSFLHR